MTGSCQINPPTVLPSGESVWPVTESTEGCGARKLKDGLVDNGQETCAQCAFFHTLPDEPKTETEKVVTG